MDAKSREQVVWLTIWGVIVLIRGYFLFRDPARRTRERMWLFGVFVVLVTFAIMVLAPIWAGAKAAAR